jgi:hypothetical protein
MTGSRGFFQVDSGADEREETISITFSMFLIHMSEKKLPSSYD